MNASRSGGQVSRRPVPLWLIVVVLAPLGLVFLTSLVLALSLAGIVALAAGARPLLRSRAQPRRSDGRTIELDASQYHRLGAAAPRDDR